MRPISKVTADEYYAVGPNGAVRKLPGTGSAFVSDVLLRPEGGAVGIYIFRGIWWRLGVSRMDDPALYQNLIGLPTPQRLAVLKVLARLLNADPLDEPTRRRLGFIKWLVERGRLTEWPPEA